MGMLLRCNFHKSSTKVLFWLGPRSIDDPKALSTARDWLQPRVLLLV